MAMPRDIEGQPILLFSRHWQLALLLASGQRCGPDLSCFSYGLPQPRMDCWIS